MLKVPIRFTDQKPEDSVTWMQKQKDMEEIHKERFKRRFIGWTLVVFASAFVALSVLLCNRFNQISLIQGGQLKPVDWVAIVTCTMFQLLLLGAGFWLIKQRIHFFVKSEDISPQERTTGQLAYWVMGAFVLGLVALLIATTYFIVNESPNSSEIVKQWTEIFKTGFVTLGGALSTIMGFFFGARQNEKTQEGASELLKSLQRTQQDLNLSQRELIDQLKPDQ
jgi:hypothetical protein